MISFDEYIAEKNRYRFENLWHFKASQELIWKELLDYRQWPSWCLALEKIEPMGIFHDLEIGNQIQTKWKGPLPYSLTFNSQIQNFSEFTYISFTVTGDLDGKGICRLFPIDTHTAVQFTWDVAPTKLWIKMSSPFARSFFIDNHNSIMDGVVTGFENLLRQKANPFPTKNIRLSTNLTPKNADRENTFIG